MIKLKGNFRSKKRIWFSGIFLRHVNLTSPRVRGVWNSRRASPSCYITFFSRRSETSRLRNAMLFTNSNPCRCLNP
ncbi:hypothetical protein Lalb_Chr03g0038361 [Lupinus albus]|uniref:Uncharacterized protein n=1 Tax=Lupinus albus TaxID=3870 RepID=A0A6A4QXQ5_LUPAL|nr:hypothetical protein Lalb_Chr03g0038361 [Lupinus albus]